LFDNIPSDEDLWGLYVQDFADNHDIVKCDSLLSKLKSLEIVKSADTFVGQIFGLHAYVAINGLKLIRAMPIFHELSELSTSGMPAEDMSVERACDVLYANLEMSIDSSDPEPELMNWYKLFLKVVSFIVLLSYTHDAFNCTHSVCILFQAMFREFFYQDLKNWSKKTILWISYLTIQCTVFSSGDVTGLMQAMFKEFTGESRVYN
jgi:hypothetical protein